MNILWFLIVGAIAGWLAGVIMKGGGFGLLGNIIIGIVGALIGGWVYSLFGLNTSSTLGAIVMSVIGAVIFLFVVGLFRGRSAHGTA